MLLTKFSARFLDNFHHDFYKVMISFVFLRYFLENTFINYG